ncbi:MAG: DEAD/DEAH box helicase [Desulfovibrio sp.]|nr:DEAD/DEAH box helicase [Desulfovibrio sp.]
MQLDKVVATAFYGNFHTLREAQQAVIEPLSTGHNIILTAGTGMGKTEAVMAPLVSKYWRNAVDDNHLFLLYIAPTKALVNDLEKRLYTPLATLNMRVGVRHGDRDDLKNKQTPHVLVTTPESLDVMLFRQDSSLRSLRAIVIDEVHLLYNTQRGLQLSILLQRLQKLISHDLQYALLSATVGDLSYVRDFLMGPDAHAELLTFPAARTIDAQIRHIESTDQFLLLIQKITMGRPTKLLIFANSRRICEKLAGILQRDDFLRDNVFTHYSSLSLEARLDIEHKFATMRTAICIATSTLELGIDIGNIDAILLWGAPFGVDSFLQRIGRGNRRSSKTNVVCLIPDDNTISIPLEALRFATMLDLSSKGELPIHEPFELFGAIGQQCLNIIASANGQFTRIAELCDLFKHKPYLNRDIVESILAELASNGFLQRHGYKNSYGADEKLHQLVEKNMIHGNFGISSQTSKLFHGAKTLGEIPSINLLKIRPGVVLQFSGKSWRVKKVSRDGIYLEKYIGNAEVIELLYAKTGILSDPYIVDRIWTFIHTDDIVQGKFTKMLFKKVEVVVSAIRKICSWKQVPFIRTKEGIIYYTFGGYVINRAISLFTEKLEYKADDISLLVTSQIDFSSFPENSTNFDKIFYKLFEPNEFQSIYQKQLPLELQKREYLQLFLKNPAIKNILSRLHNAETVDCTSIRCITNGLTQSCRFSIRE